MGYHSLHHLWFGFLESEDIETHYQSGIIAQEMLLMGHLGILEFGEALETRIGAAERDLNEFNRIRRVQLMDSSEVSIFCPYHEYMIRNLLNSEPNY